MKRIQFRTSSPDEMVFIAITCSLPDFQFVHFLNKTTNNQFIKLNDFSYSNGAGAPVFYFPFFHTYNSYWDANCFILKVTSVSGHKLISKTSNIDYFLLIDRLVAREDINQLLDDLSLIPSLFPAAEIGGAMKKELEYIIMDMELYLMEV